MSVKGKFVDVTHSPYVYQTPKALPKWGLQAARIYTPTKKNG